MGWVTEILLLFVNIGRFNTSCVMLDARGGQLVCFGGDTDDLISHEMNPFSLRPNITGPQYPRVFPSCLVLLMSGICSVDMSVPF
jgi:hypothetical protein